MQLSNEAIVQRLIRLELEHDQLLEKLEDARKSTLEMNQKLDELLALRNKGIGAFWLASALVGTGIIGVIISILGVWKHGI